MTTSAGATYELTGARESELKTYVGQRVEITGRLEDSRSSSAMGTAASPSGTSTPDSAAKPGSTSGAGTPGSMAGATPSQSATAASNTPRLTIESFRALGGSCSSQPKN
jgi:hypothetical protein